MIRSKQFSLQLSTVIGPIVQLIYNLLNTLKEKLKPQGKRFQDQK